MDYDALPRLRFRMSDLRPGVHIIAVCKMCSSSRHFYSAEELPAGIRDEQLSLIEPRLRCQDRGRNKLGPICGGRAKIDIWTPRSLDNVGPCLPRAAG